MDANKHTLLLKYSNPYSILIVTHNDKLIELLCPFTVKVIVPVETLKIFEIKKVRMVKMATNEKLVYFIDNKPFFYHYFDIIL